MSMEALRAWERLSESQGTPYIVGKQLSLYAQRHTDLAWPSNVELARSCRISARQVQRALRELEQAGEIVKVPASEGRRRVYLVTPGAPFQLRLAPGEGDTHVTQDPESVAPPLGDTQGLLGDIYAGAGSNHQNHRTAKPPLTPPQAGGRPPELIDALKRPHVTAAGQRRSRRRRRGRAESVCVGEACPISAGEQLDLDQWAELQILLGDGIGEEIWRMWLPDAHPHLLSQAELAIATDPRVASWTAERFAHALGRLAGRRVSVVGCAQLQGAGQ